MTREAAEPSADSTANERSEPAAQHTRATPDPSISIESDATSLDAAEAPAARQDIARDQVAPHWDDAGDTDAGDAWAAAVSPETAAPPSPTVSLDQETLSASDPEAPPAPFVETPPPLKPTLGLEDAPAVLKLEGITRRRGDAPSIDGFDLDVRRGEIVALLGDNGSGKTTLVNILCGDDDADRGRILIGTADGRRAPRRMRQGSPAAARAAGIGTVRRRAALAGTLTGLQNIEIGAYSLWRPTLGRRALRSKLNDLKRRLDLHVDLETRVAKLSGGERIQVEVLKVAYRGFPILVLDEPTAALTPQESAILFKALRTLADDGTSVVLTLRRPDDALAAADRVVVLRGGRKVADVRARQTDHATLAAQAAGRAVARVTPTPRSAEHAVAELSLIDAPAIGEDPPLAQMSLVVRAGEIIGVAGTPLNGQSTLVAVLTGLIKPTAGQIRLFGRNLRRSDPALFLRAGVGKVHSDCRRDALIAGMSVAENLVLERISDANFTKQGLLDTRAIRDYAAHVVSRHNVGCSDLDAPVETLSAARVRKLVLGRMFDSKPHLILVHDATRNLDLAERADVHRRLVAEREDGAAILMISDDVDELLALSDYIGVLHRGRLSVPQPSGAFDRKTLGLMMGGHGSLAQDWSGWGGGV